MEYRIVRDGNRVWSGNTFKELITVIIGNYNYLSQLDYSAVVRSRGKDIVLFHMLKGEIIFD